jgi:rifampicin phosphotransferase
MVMSAVTTTRSFQPPGPGAWELDQTHFVRPLTPFFSELFAEPFTRGFREGTRRYGMLLDVLVPTTVHGFGYMQARAVGAPAGATKPPPKLVFKALQRLHPEMRRRIATSRLVFAGKTWREDLRRWDEQVKPASNRIHRELQSVDVCALGVAELERHLVACRDNAAHMISQHHRFTAACLIPVGDYLAQVGGWTGAPTGDLLALLRGASPVSNGVASGELAELADAIRASTPAAALLESDTAPREILEKLRGMQAPLGELAERYLAAVSYRIMGYDIADLCAIERPEMLVKAVRAMADPGARRRGEERVAALTAEVRARVPADRRAAFDELLAEARLVSRLRDERGVHSDAWATGLMRRAILEVGRRAVAADLVDDAGLLIDATFAEILDFLHGRQAVSVARLRERARWRTTAIPADAPPWLGAPPAPPPPPEWLPPHAARLARAVNTYLESLFQESGRTSDDRIIRGLPVSGRTCEGIARVIRGPEEFSRLEPGDVLVTRATSAYFNTVLPLLSALVTDRGGQLSHAAIVAREYGIPGVVGTKVATSQIPDGARIRVDGDAGEVTLL